MNKKIKKYMEEIHKTEQKIADLQQYLKGLHAALKQEEDNEMIKSIRGMKLDSHALHDLLNGIQEGTVKFQVSQIKKWLAFFNRVSKIETAICEETERGI